MVLITGKTYTVKDELREMGGRWNPDVKGWEVPDEVALEARALVDAENSTEKRCQWCFTRIDMGLYCRTCEFSF